MTEQPKKKRGGPQPGSGPKPKDPADKVVKCYISMTRAHHAATEGDRSRIIRRALDKHLASISPERINKASKMERVALAELHNFLKFRLEIIAKGASVEQIENVNELIRNLLAV